MVRAAEPQELDIHALLRLFVSKVQNGAPVTYATFRDTWQETKFSFIYEGCKERHLSQDYISWLLAAAADHFWAPLPEDPCKTASAEAAGATAPAARDVRRSDTLAQQLPSIDEATEATDRVLVTVAAAAEGAESFRAGCMPDIPEISLHHALGGSDSQHEAALLSPPAEQAASPSGASTIPVMGQAQTVQLDESSLLALLMDNDDMDALEPDQQILAALERPSGSAASMPAAQDGGERPSFALKAGALYTIYTIHKTQPAYKGRRVRAYLPVSSLQAISDMLPEARQRQIPDIPSIVKCLVQEQAFVIGGVRRPPAGHQIVRDGPVRLAQVDMSERNAMQPMTMRHLANTQLALRELKHVQLLCDSYSKAQRSVFAAADPQDMPPSIADLGMGERLRDLARQITLDVHGALSGASPPLSKKQKLAEQKAAQAAAAAAAAEAQHGGSRTARKPAGDLQADLSDMGGLPSIAKAVERQKGLERAEILSKQREWAKRGARALAAAEDMPDDLSPPARQEETLARAEGGAVADNVDDTLTLAEAAAVRDMGQPAETSELAAAMARPVHSHSSIARGNGLLNGSGQSELDRHATVEDLAGKRTAAQAIASAFGDDSDSSSMDSMDRHDAPLQHTNEHVEPPASLPDQAEAQARPGKQKAEAPKKPSTRGARKRGKVEPYEAPLVSRAKRKAAAVKETAEQAGSAEAEKRPAKASKASKAPKCGKDGQGSCHKKDSTGKPVLAAGTRGGQKDPKTSVKTACTRAGPDTVDWKAYASVLDAKLAEAEALLADDSE